MLDKLEALDFQVCLVPRVTVGWLEFLVDQVWQGQRETVEHLEYQDSLV